MTSKKKSKLAIKRVSNQRELVQNELDQIESIRNMAATKRNELFTEWASFKSCMEQALRVKVEAGRHLTRARAITGAEATFAESCVVLKINVRSAYDLIRMYDFVSKKMPRAILATAPPDLGGRDINRPYGRYTDSIAKFPWPDTDDLGVASEWWTKIINDTKDSWGEKHKAKTKPKETVIGELFYDARAVLNQAAESKRLAILEEVVGMLMYTLGISSRKFEPREVPASLALKRRGAPTGPRKPKVIEGK